ncbi:MAG: hypothetical protein AAB927_04265 [Patescibacteria group bacterium]
MLKLLSKPVTPQVPALPGMTPLGITPVPEELAKVDEGRCADEFCPALTGELADPHVKSVTLAQDADTELEYVNVNHQHIGMPYKVFKVLSGTPDGRVKLMFWADNLGEWLTCVVPLNYRLTTAPDYLEAAARPETASPEVRQARAAHLATFRKPKAELIPEPAQPTNCVVGQVGNNKVLVDAGDGTILARYEANGFVASAEAQKLGRSLVKQSQATVYALAMLRRAWAEARGTK